MPEFTFQTYSAGTPAYIDAFLCGLVPCVVTSIQGKGVTVKISEDTKAYKKDEVLTFGQSTVVPRDRVFLRGMFYRINTQYAWG